MAVRKHGSGWQVDVTNRGLGVRIRRIAETKKAAHEEEARIRLQLKKNRLPKQGIEMALKVYLEGEAKSLKDYQSVLSKSRAIRPYIQGMTFDRMGEVAGHVKSDMLEKGLKPATINRRLALLKRLGSLAHEWGWIDSTPKIRMLPGEVHRHYYLTQEQVEGLAKRCPLTGDLIRLAAYTGLRRGEIFKLEPSHIRGDFIALRANTKGNRPRLIPLPEMVKDVVEDLPFDKALDHRLRVEFENARAEMGLEHIRFHDLRHTYASFLCNTPGVGLQQIGAVLGHSTPTMTARYAHLMEDSLSPISGVFKDNASLSASPVPKDDSKNAS